MKGGHFSLTRSLARSYIPFPSFHSPFSFARFLFLLAWLKSSLFPRTKIFQINSSLSCLQILPLTEPTYSLSIFHQMILLALAKAEGIRGHSSINTQRTAIFIHSLATVNYLLPRGETLFHLPPINFLELFKDFLACKIVLAANHQHPKVFKDFFACKNVLAANHQHPKIFKDFFACKIVLAANDQHPKIFKDFFACKIVLAANHQLYPGKIQKTSSQLKQQSRRPCSDEHVVYLIRKKAFFSSLLRRPAGEWYGSTIQDAMTWSEVRTLFITRFSDKKEQV